jgi:predicted SprT family Zn-dependent metalloprotease
MPADTTADYRTLAQAYAFFNAELFAGELPPVLITLQRQANTRGYYAHGAFRSRANAEERVSEIALNPDVFPERTDEEILSTLAHEMAHVWQAYRGKPGRGGYHNAEWAAKMDEIGLLPVRADGKQGKTGEKMTHTIAAGGAFERAARRLLAGSRLQWQSCARTADEQQTAAKKRASKTKFTCPSCGQNAWAKPDAMLMCVPCQEVMTAEEDDGER